MLLISHIHEISYLPISHYLAHKENISARTCSKKQWLHRSEPKEEKRSQQRNSDFGFCNVNTKTVQIDSSGQFGRKNVRLFICKKLFYLTKQQISAKEIGEVLKLEMSVKGIIRNQCARSRHHTLIKRRKEKQADLDKKKQLSGSDKTTGIQLLSKIRPE